MGRVPSDSEAGEVKRTPLPSKIKDFCHRALRSTRSTALTAHRAVIHDRRLRFAYPGGEGLCAYGAKQLDKLKFDIKMTALQPSFFYLIRFSKVEAEREVR